MTTQPPKSPKAGNAQPEKSRAQIRREEREAYRKQLDYFSQAKNVVQLMAPLARTRPTTLACMHGSAWKGDGERLLTELGRRLSGD